MFDAGPAVCDPRAHVAAGGAPVPVHYFAPARLGERLRAFRDGFPGCVTYAVKANPDPLVLERLVAGGIGELDVASPGEIALVRGLSPGAALNYNNPVRSRAEIAAGVAAGVASWAVDCAGELAKLAEAEMVPRGAEVAVRFKLAVPGAAYDFGAKFGAEPAEAATLLAAVAELGFRPALTFHVGTQNTDPAAWETCLRAAARIAAAAGVAVGRVNVGGGFPAARDGGAADLRPFFAAIGRGAAAFPLPRLRAVAPDGRLRIGGPKPRAVFGPTCDSLDRIPGAVPLPEDLAEGDWLIFDGMGAYLNGATTVFNGYGARETVLVDRL